MKKAINKGLALLLASVLSVSLLAGCGAKEVPAEEPAVTAPATEEPVAEPAPAAEEPVAEPEEEVIADDTVIRIGALSGPTAMGMVKLMDDAANGITEGNYEFADLATEASAFVPALAKGELDMAAVPSNLAATLYNNTEGGVQVLAVNALGVLYVLQRGDDITSMADLAGKKVYATGQGAVPDYVIRALLAKEGLDADKDLELVFCADTTEALAYISADESAVAILPQPFATAACAQVEGLHPVIDLNDAWANAGFDFNIATGCVVVRKAFAEEHPACVETFLKEYAASVAFTAEDPAATAELIVNAGILPKAPIAEKALPKCHIVCITGAEMKSTVEGFLGILFEQNPKAVGGALPAEDFYYGA